LEETEMTLANKRGLVVGIANDHSIAAFLASDGARSLTGNVEYVDAGYHIMG
jgi:enoyl-[acyl-carrier protein] reductase I